MAGRDPDHHAQSAEPHDGHPSGADGARRRSGRADRHRGGLLSAPTFGLLKRPDEGRLVEMAHRNPKFVEDVVRDVLERLLKRYPKMPDGTWVRVNSEAEESIHKHNALAERSTTFGELRSM